MSTILILSLAGIGVGLLAGLLGVGGGIIVVPVLAWFFRSSAMVPATHLMHIAIGTSLATIVVTSISSILSHQRRGAILWKPAWQLTPGLVIGALAGAAIADLLSTEHLRITFALFVLLVALQLGLGAQPAPHRQLPHGVGMGMIGSGIGIVSGIVGIGGGSMTVPFLIGCNIGMRNAVATSAVCGLPIAIAGVIGFMATGWHLNEQFAWNSGYIYWPAFAAITVTSLLFAPLGAKLAYSLPVKTLKRFFAVFLAVVGVKMLLES